MILYLITFVLGMFIGDTIGFINILKGIKKRVEDLRNGKH
jgi:hypothetical protein